MPVDKSIQYSCGPLLGMKIEKLHGALILKLLHFTIQSLVAGPCNWKYQIHPIAQQFPNLIRYFIMHNFPYDLHYQVNYLFIIISLYKIEQCRQYYFQKLVEWLSLLFLDTYFEICLHGYYHMQYWDTVLVAVQACAENFGWHPLFIHKADNDADNFLVHFEE